MAPAAVRCSGCGSSADANARFCTACGIPITKPVCVSCGHAIENGAKFCTKCGTAVDGLVSSEKAPAPDHLISAIRLLINRAHPERILQECKACLAAQPDSSKAALASVISMSCYARLDNFPESERAVFRAREFYADHLGLSGECHTKFVRTGCFIEELQPVGDREVQANPWLYFIMGHAYGPSAPDGYIGETDSERNQRAMEAWSTFFADLTAISGSFAHLLFSNGQYAEAARHLERILLIARKYEAVSAIRIERLWPCSLLGDCYWANNQKEKAGAAWRRARSVELCTSLDHSDIDDWERLAIPWIEKAKASLAAHNIAVPVPEVSLRASQHLQEAMRCLLEAEQFEARGIDLEELSSLIRQAGRKYSMPLEHARSEIEMVERLDPFTWTKSPHQDSSYWWRYESVKGFLFQKMALLHISNEKLALAIANYKQANELWPTWSSFAVMGGLQAACGLVSDARSTYQTCIERADELSAVESSVDSEQMLRDVRQALRGLE